MKKNNFLLLAAAVFALNIASPAWAAGESVKPPEREWKHHGLTGTYDRGELQRGFQVYKEVCAACHSMSLLSYRNLEKLGYTPEQVKAVAAEYTVLDGPNDEGEMFERPARPSDRFKAPFMNDRAARAANGGALPPDMSLIVKARHYGENYLHALLTGYEEPPEGTTLLPGMYWNKYFPGHQMAMAPPLVEGQVSYADGTEATVDQMAHDVTAFLAFASEPHMEDRKQIGIKVVLFLLVFAVIMYAVKRKVWKDVR
jgi:ubiquinol-cytochrome c reductase cytochrome c1 subunit